MKKGLLLINLGTPDNPDVRSVRRYLREFLADKRVIALPAPLRYLLLYGIILPFRAPKTAKAYQSIWTSNGSPLKLNSENLLKKIQDRLNNDVIVSLGMRYGTPSIQTALESLEKCSEITVLPLYPQYSEATTQSSIEKVHDLLADKPTRSIRIIQDFHDHPAFINAQAELIKPYLTGHDYVLFSYHGLPEQHIIQSGCKSVCKTPCPITTERNSHCYRAQCYQTTRCIAQQLQLNDEHHSTSFQSRLGKTPWIQPYTDEVLQTLAQQGIKRLAIACPSFVSDCLETLEEIAIRAKQQWLTLGGSQLTLIPCLNDNDVWVDAILAITGYHSSVVKSGFSI